MSELSIQWLILFVDVSLKAALVALVAAAGLSLLRVRDSNLRHRVWAGVLCGMLLLPALTQILPALRLPFTVDPEWFASLKTTDLACEADDDARRAGRNEAIAVSEPVVDPLPAPLDLETMANREGRAMADHSNWPGARDGWPDEFPAASLPGRDDSSSAIPDNSSNPPPVAATESIGPGSAVGQEKAAGVVQSAPRIILSRLPLVFWGLWVFGGLALAMRLLVGLWMARALRRASRPIHPAELPPSGSQAPPGNPLRRGSASRIALLAQSPETRGGASQALRSQAEPGNEIARPRRNVPILACPLIRVPLTLGVLRPQILLPPDWTDWPVAKLHVVLVHERRHAERGDCALALMAEVNRCLYWLHPLAWWLRRRLASLAEAACDDAVIGSTGDPASYARHLLEIAATARAHRGRLVIGSVSMARCSSVESRIDTILDFTRPLSQRLTWRATVVLLGIIIPLIAFTAALRPSTVTEYTVQSTQYPEVDTQIAIHNKSESAGVVRTEDPELRTENSVLGAQHAVLSTSVPDAQVSPPAADSDSNSSPKSTPDSDATFTFAGIVVDESGQPVAGAAISLNYFRKNPTSAAAPRAALTDARGKFEFSSKTSDFTDSITNDFWMDAGVAAVKEGYGFAFVPAPYFETTGRVMAQLSDRQRAQIAFGAGEQTTVLKLVRDDVPIRGRILNAEGLPVIGARIDAVDFWEGKEGTLDAWEAAVKEEVADFRTVTRPLREIARANRMQFYWLPFMVPPASRRTLGQGNLFTGTRPPLVATVHTGADGWFTLAGIGRERIAEIRISRPGIETTEVLVRSRPGETVWLPENSQQRRQMNQPQAMRVFYPNEFTLVAGLSVTVTGRITSPVKERIADMTTAQPLAGIGVQATSMSTGSITSADGTYRLDGLPLGNSELLIIPPPGSRYLAGSVSVTTAAARGPVVRDVALARGILIRGRAIGDITERPVPGRVEYFAYATNPHLGKSDSLTRLAIHPAFATDADGRFEIPVLPGQGILAFTTESQSPRGVGADEIDCDRIPAGSRSTAVAFQTAPRICRPVNHNVLLPLNPKPDDELTVDFTLSAGTNVAGGVLSPAGKPLSGYLIYGQRKRSPWKQIAGEGFTVGSHFPPETRRLFVYHPAQNLAGHYELTGKPPEKLEITLAPAATIAGRVVDEQGAPIANAMIFDSASLGHSPNAAELGREYAVLPADAKGEYHVTDSEGRFAIPGIIPGLKYMAQVRGPKLIGDAPVMLPLGAIFADVTAASGETKNLGDVRPTPDDEKPVATKKTAATPPVDRPVDGTVKRGKKIDPAAGAVPKTANSELSTQYSVPDTPSSSTGKAGVGAVPGDGDGAAKPAASQPRTIRGRVADVAGKPIAGVALYVQVNAAKQPELRDDLKLDLRATTDPEGRFSAKILESDFAPRAPTLSLIALHPDFAVEWCDVPDQTQIPPVEIVLHPEQIVRGRMIDAEGRPVAGASVALRYLQTPQSGDSLDPLLAERKRQTAGGMIGGMMNNVRYLAANGLPKSFGSTSDGQGRIELRGVAAERFCAIAISAPDFATTNVLVANRQGLDAAPYNQPSRRARALTPDLLVGPEFTLVGVPGLTIEGRATAAGGKPVADLRVGATPLGRMLARAVTDADGRYRLSGLPRGRPLAVSFATEEHADLLPRTVRISPLADERLATINVEMKSGVIVSGRIIDPLTGGRIWAGVNFVPLPGNEYVQQPGYKDVDFGSLIGRADEDGNFRFAVVPGPGVLMVEAYARIDAASVFRPATISDEDAVHIKPQDQGVVGRYFATSFGQIGLDRANAVKYVNFAEDGGPQTVNMTLDRGKTVELEFVDGAGEPVAGALVSGISAQPGGRVSQLKESRTKIYALGADRPRKVVALNAERGLAGTVTLTGDETAPVKVALRKSAAFHGRAVDEAGDPIGGAEVQTFYQSDSPQQLQQFLNSSQPQISTDKDGRFRLMNLIPGEQFRLSLRFDGRVLSGKLTKEQQMLKPGDDLELGDVVFAPQRQ